jgi:MFS family permease
LNKSLKLDKPLRAYATVTASYWSFMLTDGALRMLVLLHFNALGFSPLQLAWLFLLYELAGIITNLSAGWLAARFGLLATLYSGLIIQIGALSALAGLDNTWSITSSVIFVMAVQGAAGIAKDLTKMSSKSAVKLLAPSEDGTLFRWVAILTGSKNAIKGLGFFLGAALLALVGFKTALWIMAIGLSIILIAIFFNMPPGLPGRSKKAEKLKDWQSKDVRINKLSLARLFLFGARDVWFVVGLPIYFQSVFSDGTPEGNREAFFLVGSFMAIWIIGYGFVQSLAPRLIGSKNQGLSMVVGKAISWSALLVPMPLILSIAVWSADGSSTWLTLALVFGLLIFGFIFAINSSLHSYLILAFGDTDRITRDVGFYYMANSAGRLIGTLLSGLSYQFGGLALCLAVAGLMTFLSWFTAKNLKTI